MLSWLAAAPSWLGLLVFTLLPAGLAIAAHRWFRGVVKAERLLPHHDVAGFLVAVVGVLYAVVLGFLVVNVWTAFDSSQRNADTEAGDVGELFAIAQTLEEPLRSRVQTLIADYAFEVRDVEWPLLERREQDGRARQLMVETLHAIVATPIDSKSIGTALGASMLRGAAFNDLHDLSVHRRQRLLDADVHLSGTLYIALAFGAIILLAFVFLFGVDDAALQLTMTGLVAGTVGLLLGVIVEFDRPYRGAIQVSSAAWTLVIDNNELARFRSPKPAVSTATQATRD